MAILLEHGGSSILNSFCLIPLSFLVVADVQDASRSKQSDTELALFAQQDLFRP